MLDMAQDGAIEAAEQFGAWIPGGSGGMVGLRETGCERLPGTLKVRVAQALAVHSRGRPKVPELVKLGLRAVSVDSVIL